MRLGRHSPKSKRAGQKTLSSSDSCCPGRWASPVIYTSYERRSPIRPVTTRAVTSSRGRTSTATTPISRVAERYSKLTTSPISTAAGLRARRCCEIRVSRQWSCATVSRRIGGRKAGPPDASRSARQTSNAAWIRRAANDMNVFSELKRRNVYKVAAAYAVIGWLLVQVATQVFPFFEIPNWAVRLIVLGIVIGFPIALVIAWAFELTSLGLKRTEGVDLTAQGHRNS